MIEFKTSSFCSGGACVEVGMLPCGAVAVRDSKDRTRELVFTAEEWGAFLAGAKAGEFELPAKP